MSPTGSSERGMEEIKGGRIKEDEDKKIFDSSSNDGDDMLAAAKFPRLLSQIPGPDWDSNLDLPVISKPVQHGSDVLDHAATEAGSRPVEFYAERLEGASIIAMAVRSCRLLLDVSPGNIMLTSCKK
uniref:Uncharacterized protein n=1 Tax=Timema tahoe TaxID=61484 RepID=A0A7R9FJ49_9NEOP|nr:unnamed protein product [Timema tahoe]